MTCKYAVHQPVRVDSPYFEMKGFICYQIPAPAEPQAAKERRPHRRHVRRLHLERQAEVRGIIQRLLEWPRCNETDKAVELTFGVDEKNGVVAAGWYCPDCSKVRAEMPGVAVPKSVTIYSPANSGEIQGAKLRGAHVDEVADEEALYRQIQNERLEGDLHRARMQAEANAPANGLESIMLDVMTKKDEERLKRQILEKMGMDEILKR